MGLINITLSSDMYDEPFLAQRNVKTQKIRGRDKPYFYEVEREPLTFRLSFAFLETWDDNKIRNIARWLNQDYYKEFYMSDNPNKRYFAILNDDSRLIHNGLKQGYIELNFLCDSSYAYSPVYETELLDFTTNPLIFTDNIQTGIFDNTENNPSLILMYYSSWNDNEGLDETTGFDETKEYTLENDASEFWNDWFGVSFVSHVPDGTRISNPINLTFVGVVIDSKISWTQLKPSNTDIKTYISLNEGNTWAQVTNNNSIPNINTGMDLTNVNILIKQELSTADALITPELTSNVSLEFRKGISVINNGDVNLKPELWILKSGDNNGDIIIENLTTSKPEFKFITATYATGIFTLTDGVSDKETVTIGNDVFEFDINNVITSGNILVDISGGTKVQASCTFTLDETVFDGEKINIGDDIYEIDTDGNFEEGNIQVDLSLSAVAATGTLTFTSVPINGETVRIGYDVYEFDTNSNVTAGNIRVNINSISTIDNIITVLVDVINNKTNENITATADLVGDSVLITCTIPGSIGNTIVTSETCSGASWGDNYLINGSDPSVVNSIMAINSAINLAIGYQSSYLDNIITISATAGSIYDGSIGNYVNVSTTCKNGTLSNSTLLGGLDCSHDTAGNALMNKINTSSTENVTVINITSGENTALTIRHNQVGIAGYLEVDTTCKYANWSNSKLTGGDGLIDNENVYVDNENQHIETDLENTYRYDIFNDNYLDFVIDENILKISGLCKLQFRYRYKYLQG